MTKLIRAEFFKIAHSASLLLLTLAAIALNVFLGSRSRVELTDLYGLPELSTVGVFVSYFEERNLSADSAKAMMEKKGYLEPGESRAETLIEVFEDIQPYQFRLVLRSVKGMLLLPLLLLYLYILRDFRTRSYVNSLCAGCSRAEVYFSKAAMFLSVSFIVSLLSVLLLVLSYANTVFSRLPAGYAWGRCLLCACSTRHFCPSRSCWPLRCEGRRRWSRPRCCTPFWSGSARPCLAGRGKERHRALGALGLPRPNWERGFERRRLSSRQAC
jgi:hypothetical protein